MEARLTKITIQELSIGGCHALYSGYYDVQADDDSFHIIRYYDDEDGDLCKTTCAVYSNNIFGYELLVIAELPRNQNDE